MNATQTQSVTCELVFPSPILAVRLNGKRLVVVVKVAIFIYNLQTDVSYILARLKIILKVSHL